MGRRSNTKQQDLIDWRRIQVWKLKAIGKNQTEIAKELQVSTGTVSYDMQAIAKQAREKANDGFADRLVMIIEQALTSLDMTKQEAWKMATDNNLDKRTKLYALDLFRDCSVAAVDIVAHDRSVSEVLRFIESKKKKKELLLTNGIKESTQTADRSPESDNTIREDPEAVF